MRINYTVIKEPVSDRFNNYVIFESNFQSALNGEPAELLDKFVDCVKRQGLNVQQAVLAFEVDGKLKFLGSSKLINYLMQKSATLDWTHTLDV